MHQCPPWLRHWTCLIDLCWKDMSRHIVRETRFLCSPLLNSTVKELLQAGQLPETDRASAFAVDRVKNFLHSSLITTQNLFAVSHNVHIVKNSNQILRGDQTSDLTIGTGFGTGYPVAGTGLPGFDFSK